MQTRFFIHCCIHYCIHHGIHLLSGIYQSHCGTRTDSTCLRRPIRKNSSCGQSATTLYCSPTSHTIALLPPRTPLLFHLFHLTLSCSSTSPTHSIAPLPIFPSSPYASLLPPQFSPSNPRSLVEIEAKSSSIGETCPLPARWKIQASAHSPLTPTLPAQLPRSILVEIEARSSPIGETCPLPTH